ncbi:hypothetical protein ACFE04_021775 [Oxalis oulophora]
MVAHRYSYIPTHHGGRHFITTTGTILLKSHHFASPPISSRHVLPSEDSFLGVVDTLRNINSDESGGPTVSIDLPETSKGLKRMSLSRPLSCATCEWRNNSKIIGETEVGGATRPEIKPAKDPISPQRKYAVKGICRCRKQLTVNLEGNHPNRENMR